MRREDYLLAARVRVPTLLAVPIRYQQENYAKGNISADLDMNSYVNVECSEPWAEDEAKGQRAAKGKLNQTKLIP